MAKPGVDEIILMHLVYTGVDTLEKLSEKLEKPTDALKELTDRLEITGYMEERTYGLVWKRKRYRLTEQGLRELLRFKRKVCDDIEEALHDAGEGLVEEARDILSAYASHLEDLRIYEIVGKEAAKRAEAILE